MIKKYIKTSVALLMLVAATAAQAYPDKPITMIVPFAVGSNTDVIARAFGDILYRSFGQPVIFDNRTGAEGMVGTRTMLSAPTDGYTLLFASSSVTVLDPLLKKSLPYDPVKDLAPVCSVGRTPFLLNITGSSKYRSVDEVIAAAKASPGKLTFGYSSASTRLAGELFQQFAEVKFLGVPYRSSVTGLTDVAGGQVDMFFIDHVSASPFYLSDKVRPLVTSAPTRMIALPDVPTSGEVGLSGFNVLPWYGVFMSAEVPKNIQGQVRQAISQTLRSPEMTKFYKARNLMSFSICDEELGKFQRDEIALWRKVINQAGIQAE